MRLARTTQSSLQHQADYRHCLHCMHMYPCECKCQSDRCTCYSGYFAVVYGNLCNVLHICYDEINASRLNCQTIAWPRMMTGCHTFTRLSIFSSTESEVVSGEPHANHESGPTESLQSEYWENKLLQASRFVSGVPAHHKWWFNCIRCFG